jgi:NifU-like protein involved in Fe-S cluster formation
MEYSAEVRQRFAAALGTRAGSGERLQACASGEAEDRALGVWIRARLAASDGRIDAAAFDVFGCPDTIAAAQCVAERLIGMRLDEFDGLGVRALAAELAIPTDKLGKLLRIEDAVQAAISQARGRT